MARLTVFTRILPDGRTFTARGREAWALLELAKAGPKGCTPIDNPGPRWSAHDFSLKHEFGLEVETKHEPHRGYFPGIHARNVLLSPVEIVSRSNQPVEGAA